MKTLMLFIALFSIAGCAASPQNDAEQTILPSMEPNLPQLQMKFGWNNQLYQIPEPVIIPPETISTGFAAWERGGYNGNWPIKLADGRTAVMMVGRFKTNDPAIDRFGVFMVWVYCPDGTLQMELTNAGGDQQIPMVNAPEQWTIYEADGKTKSIEVNAYHKQVQNIIYYEAGKQVREYSMSTDEESHEFVVDEYAYDSHGQRKGVHLANGYLGKVLLYNP